MREGERDRRNERTNTKISWRVKGSKPAERVSHCFCFIIIIIVFYYYEYFFQV